MTRSIIFLSITACMLSCNNPGDKLNTTEQGSGADSAAATTPASSENRFAGCYTYVVAGDTVTLQLEQKGENLAGPLSYNYFEKDRNDGNFEGMLSGDTLTGYYLFRSEGIMSVRQEIWKSAHGELWPASGPMMQRKDSMLFENPATIQFDSTRALKKIPCVI